MQNSDLMQRINKEYSRLSKGHKTIASFITDSLDEAAFLTAAEIGRVCSVSESTVVRFATKLGYSGFPKLQEAMADMVQSKLSVTNAEPSALESSKSNTLSSVMHSDIEKIKRTMEEIDNASFDMAVDVLLNAKKIYIIGIRSCSAIASFLAFYLDMMFDDVILISTTNTSELFEQMIRIGENDAIIGISFPRYSMRTLKAMEFANSRRAKVITITDSPNSPMNLYSSCNLIAKSGMFSVVDSLVAPLSVINALIVSLCVKRKNEIADRMDALEKVWDDYQFYENDELSRANDSIRMQYNDIPEDIM
ncbi:MAG: MurR/RpiR family transcriptional regulator [Lachnospiraceae bacterium]|nr:MurR/RpiR family transcriptional regulator [Lachnospiraceae bacterium]